MEQPRCPHELVMAATRKVRASPATAWAIMTDHAGYADVADNLSKVEVLHGEGLGMVRRCYDTRGRGWSETADLWRPQSAYGFRIHTEAPDYPYPLRALCGRWTLEPAEGGVLIGVSLHASPRFGALGRLLLGSQRRKMQAVLERLLDRWAERMEAGAEAEARA
jgi:hypothetical protein